MGPVLKQPQETVLELEHDVQKELLKHPGKWVALTRSKILAVGDTADEALEAAHAAGHKDPGLYRVPEKARSYFF